MKRRPSTATCHSLVTSHWLPHMQGATSAGPRPIDASNAVPASMATPGASRQEIARETATPQYTRYHYRSHIDARHTRPSDIRSRWVYSRAAPLDGSIVALFSRGDISLRQRRCRTNVRAPALFHATINDEFRSLPQHAAAAILHYRSLQ